MPQDAVVAWLLEGGPAVRWQVERDLLGLPEEVWGGTRRSVATEGVVKRLVDHQDDDGRWGGGHYQPKWTSTVYTLLALARLGLGPGDKRAVAGCQRLLDDAIRVGGGVSYWPRHKDPELCVNAMVLSVSAAFGVVDERVGSIARLLLEQSLDDGGWNCRSYRGDQHSSFHTTILALEALAQWRLATGDGSVSGAIASGHEFMLEHRLYRSHRSGDVIDERWTIPHFPPRWHYDVLRGLDHLRDAAAAPDARAAEAVETVVARRLTDGRWPKGRQYSGKTFLALESAGRGGRWNTLRALRVLRWWSGDSP